MGMASPVCWVPDTPISRKTWPLTATAVQLDFLTTQGRQGRSLTDGHTERSPGYPFLVVGWGGGGLEKARPGACVSLRHLEINPLPIC